MASTRQCIPTFIDERLKYFAYQYRRPQIEIPFYFRRLLFDGFSLQEWCPWVK